MKRFILLSFVAWGLAAAAGVLDVRSRPLPGAASRADKPAEYTGMIVELADEAAGLATLEAAGAVIWHRRDELVLCCVPTSNLNAIDTGAGLVHATSGAKVSAMMDVARRVARIDGVQQGVAPLPWGFDGEGVIAGFVDTGFDPAHDAFSDGRVAQLTMYDTENATRQVFARPTAAPDGEAVDDCHATHVASILAGRRIEGSPYHGVATGAEIVASVSDLTEASILAGIDDIIEYARAQGKPAVINASLGCVYGPHDGSTLFNRYAAKQAREAILVFSAGNDGGGKSTLRHEFTAGKTSLATALLTWQSFEMNGLADVWASDGEPLEISLSVFDYDTRRYVATTDFRLPDFTVDTADPSSPLYGFDKYFDGYVSVAGEVDRLNSRRHVIVRFEYASPEHSADGNWARYMLVLGVKGEPGTRVDMFTEGESTMFRHIADGASLEGNSELSISDMACTPGIISVGMFADRSGYPLLDAPAFDDGTASDVISPYSSYGTLDNGAVKPDIIAPGSYVVAAFASPFYAAHPDEYPVVAETRDSAGHQQLWTAMRGTSMASPMVAGVIAMMLEARPELDAAEALTILQATSRRDFADKADPRYGASGLIDAQAAMEKLLHLNALDIPVADGSPAIFHDLSGRPVASPQTPGLYIRRNGTTAEIVVFQ